MIYYCFRIITGEGYVGQTSGQLKGRINRHRSSESKFGKAIRKYGIESFKIVILYEGNDDLDLREIHWIETLNTLDPNGYNVLIGGRSHRGWGLHEESCRAISIANKGRVVARKITEEQVRQLRRVNDKSVEDFSIEWNLPVDFLKRIKKYEIYNGPNDWPYCP
jgi:group I intron endonuclease